MTYVALDKDSNAIDIIDDERFDFVLYHEKFMKEFRKTV
jgi:hypothetical protein